MKIKITEHNGFYYSEAGKNDIEEIELDLPDDLVKEWKEAFSKYWDLSNKISEFYTPAQHKKYHPKCTGQPCVFYLSYLYHPELVQKDVDATS